MANKKININDFFKLPVKKQEKIMSEIAGEANKDQQDLVRRYEKKFGQGKTKQVSGC